MSNTNTLYVHEYYPGESFITDEELKASGFSDVMTWVRGIYRADHFKTMFTFLVHNSGGMSNPTVILAAPDRVGMYKQHMQRHHFGHVDVFGLDDGSPENVLRLVKLHRRSRCLYLDFPGRNAEDYAECGPLCDLGLVAESSRNAEAVLQSALVQAFKGGKS